MKNRVFIIVLIVIIGIILLIPNCFATTAGSISASKTKAEAGETIEIYIDLGIQSIAHDLKVSLSDESLVKSSNLASSIGTGTASRIYLVQVKSESERKVYEPGTRLATLKYTLSDNISENKSLIVTVKGDIAGLNSSEKNEIDESITINITPKLAKPQKDEDTQNNENNGNNNGQKDEGQNNNENTKEGNAAGNNNIGNDEGNNGNPQQGIGDNKEPEDEPKQVVTISLADSEKEKESEIAKITSNANKGKPTDLPYTGGEIGIILIIAGLIILQVPIIIAYKK